MTDSKYMQAAVKAGEWLLNTQQKKCDDANCGRFYYTVNLEDKQIDLSSGWQTGFAIIALISLHKATGEEKYLDSAKQAIDYIKTLQILDSRRASIFGAIREETPQTQWLHPRDALSAGWAFLLYGQYCNDQDCMERAVLFADWLMAYGFCEDWPLCTIKLGDGGFDSDDLQGSFQSGGILYFIDMYKATQDLRYYNVALRMSDYYVDNFIDETGLITVLIDPIGNNAGINDTEKWPVAWQLMHQVNDDFGGIALAGSYELFKRDKYLSRMSAYFKWLQGVTNGDGSYLDPVMEVASATVPIFLNSYKKLAPENEKNAISDTSTKALDFLLTLQQDSDDANINGAFLGMNNKCRDGLGEWVNIRCTAYAIIALLQASDNSAFPA